MAFDSYSDTSSTGPAYTAAAAFAAENPVWDEAADVSGSDIEFSACPSWFMPGGTGTSVNECVQVSAYRTEARGNAIPTVLASVLGSWMDVSATAIGYAMNGNVTACLKPFASPDRWVEHYPTSGAWVSTARFDIVDPSAAPALISPASARDSYSFPGDTSAGTGFTKDSEFGLSITLSPGTTSSPISEIKPWLYLPVQIPGSQWGDNNVRANTNACAGEPIAIGRVLNLASGVAPAAAVGQGLLDLYNLDPDATWNAETQRVENSCADFEVGRCATMSPRIIAVPVYDPKMLAEQSRAGTIASVKVRNIVGFFISSVNIGANSVTGYITRHPGLRDPNAVILSDASSFLRTSMLVQ